MANQLLHGNAGHNPRQLPVQRGTNASEISAVAQMRGVVVGTTQLIFSTSSLISSHTVQIKSSIVELVDKLVFSPDLVVLQLVALNSSNC